MLKIGIQILLSIGFGECTSDYEVFEETEGIYIHDQITDSETMSGLGKIIQ